MAAGANNAAKSDADGARPLTQPIRISDAELRTRELHIVNPYLQQNLVDTLPPDLGLVDVENTYSFDQYPREKVRCAKCLSRRHKKGFTGLLADDKRALLGSACGAEVFGESWVEATRRLKERDHRKFSLIRLDQLARIIPDILAEVSVWGSAVATAVRARKDLATAMPTLSGLLRDAAMRDGALKTYVRVKVNNVGRDGRMSTSIRNDERSHGPIPGRAFLAAENPQKVLDQLDAALQALGVAQKGETDGLSNATLLALYKPVADGAKQLEAIRAFLSGATAFFENENLAQIAAWAALHKDLDNTYRADNGALRWGEGGCTASLSAEFRMPDQQIFRLLQSANAR